MNADLPVTQVAEAIESDDEPDVFDISSPKDAASMEATKKQHARERRFRHDTEADILVSFMSAAEAASVSETEDSRMISATELANPLWVMGKIERRHFYNAPVHALGTDGQLHVRSIPPKLFTDNHATPSAERTRSGSRQRSARLPPSRASLNDINRDQMTGQLMLFGFYFLTEPRYNKGSSSTRMLNLNKDFTEEDMVKEICYLRKQGVEMQEQSASRIQGHMIYTKHWNVTREMILSILAPRKAVVSVGFLPFDDITSKAAAAREAEADRVHSSVLAGDKDKDPESSIHRTYQKEMHKLRELKAAKEYKHPSIFDFIEHKHNTNSLARLHIKPSSNIKTDMHIVIEQNYDDRQQSKQPFHRFDVHLTENNIRRRNSEDSKRRAFSTRARHMRDVTGLKFIPMLTKLFPHTQKLGANYFARLQLSLNGYDRLILIMLPHNDEPWTSNLFTLSHKAPVFNSISHAMKNSPLIFILARMSVHGADVMMRNTLLDFAKQVKYDPLTDLFVNRGIISIDSAAIEPADECQSFTAPEMVTFEDWTAYKIRIGLAAFKEIQFDCEKYTYCGKAIIVPVPNSFHPHHKLHMSYAMSVLLEDDDDMQKPRLEEGDTIAVTFRSTIPGQRTLPWNGIITERIAITGNGELTIFVDRPVHEDKIDDDRTDFVNFNADADIINSLNPVRLMELTRKSPRISVTILRSSPSKHLEHLSNSFQRLQIAKKMVQDDDSRVAVIKQIRNLFMAKDIAALPRSSLADYLSVDVDATDGQLPLYLVMSHVRSGLRDYQLPFFDFICSDGILADWILLGGPSGTGKTQVAKLIACLFLGETLVSGNRIEARNEAMLDFFERQALSEKSKELLNSLLPEATQQGEYRIGGRSYRDTGKPNQYSELGRVTIVTAQNTTGHKMYEQVQKEMPHYCEARGLPSPLVVFMHSRSTEVALTKAMLHSAFEEAKTNPDLLGRPPSIDPKANLAPNTNVTNMLEVFIRRFRGSKFFQVFDSRVANPDSSVAKRVLELALSEDLQSPELKAGFSKKGLDDLRHITQLFQEARKLQSASKKNLKGEFNKAELNRKLGVLAEVGIDWILMNASVVISTSFTATEERFAIHRDTHLLVIEEITRMHEAEIVGLAARYPYALKFGSGDYRQLPAGIYGDKKFNPFQPQLKLTFLERMLTAGFPVFEFSDTFRFRNEHTLHIAQLANQLPGLRMGYGAANEDALRISAHLNKTIWHKESPVLFLNVEKSRSRQDSTQSWYNIDMARVAVHDVVNRVRAYPGSQVALISPYKAQTSLHRQMLEIMVKATSEKGHHSVSEQLKQVLIKTPTTIDTYMGDEAETVVVDLAGVAGHVMELPRADVAFTRAKDCMIIIGDLQSITNSHVRVPNHPLKLICRSLYQKKHVVSVTAQHIRGFYPFKELLASYGTQK